MPRVFALLLSLLFLVSCSAPASKNPDAAVGPNPFEKPVAQRPITTETPEAPKRSCKTDADCVVKDVGNCCGHYPACVAKDARVNPAAVRAKCAKEGRMAVCGFPVISACSCVQGMCQAASGATS